MIAWCSAALAGTVLVAAPDFPDRSLQRVIQQGQKMGATALPVADGVWCLDFPEEPDADWVRRAGKRLGEPLEPRATCAEARYPAGAGWLVAVLSPDPSLEDRLALMDDGLTATVLAQPSGGRPATFCVSRMQIDAQRLTERLRAAQIDVQSVHDVGGCDSRVHAP